MINCVQLFQFLSTPSARRATKEIYAQGSAADISIHALREEGDSRTSRSTSQKRNFYPRPPRGGRRSLVSASNVTFRFLSTPSARRATKSPLAGFPHQRDFYPRPPRGGRRIMDCAGITKRGFLSTPSTRRATIVQAKLDFYPRPPRGGRPPIFILEETAMSKFLSTPSARRATRALFARFTKIQRFLSTPSARRATGSGCEQSQKQCYFYPRPPRGGRQPFVTLPCCSFGISIHALREEGDRLVLFYYRPDWKFLSTPSARRATKIRAWKAGDDEFLSTPSARRAT